MGALPSHIGQHTDVTRAGKILRMVKVRADTFHAREIAAIRRAEGPSGSRWGTADEIREDIDRWLDTGSLPMGGGGWA